MATYIIHFEKIQNGTIEVDAKDEEEAVDEAENHLISDPEMITWDRPEITNSFVQEQ